MLFITLISIGYIHTNVFMKNKILAVLEAKQDYLAGYNRKTQTRKEILYKFY